MVHDHELNHCMNILDILVYKQFYQLSIQLKNEGKWTIIQQASTLKFKLNYWKKSNNDVKYLRMLVYLNPSEVGFAAQVAGFGVLVSPR